MIKRTLCTAVVLAAALAGCGEEERTATGSSGDADIEAHEQNTVELDGVRYRVMIFRQLNPRITPDRVLYDGALPEGDSGIFAAFIEACNVSGRAQRTAGSIWLEDAFGEPHARLDEVSQRAYDYEATSLSPDECLPREDSAADRAFPGAAVLFRVPFDELGSRPFVLNLRDRGVRRIELDV